MKFRVILALSLFTMSDLRLSASSVSAQEALSRSPYPYASMFRADPKHTGVMEGPGPSWKSVELWRFDTGISSTSTPVAGIGLVFVSGSAVDAPKTSCFLFAFESYTGTEKWRAPGFCGTGPAVVDNLVYATGIETVTTVTPVNGRFPLSSIVAALDATTGDELWRTRLDFAIYSAITVTPDSIFVAGKVPGYQLDEGIIASLDRDTGGVQWQAIVGDEQPDTREYIYSTPAVDHGRGVLYVGVNQVGTIALDTRSGHELWRSPYGNYSSPLIAEDVVIIGGIEGTLYALNSATGDLTWSFHTGAPIFSSAAVSGGLVCFPSTNGVFYALDVVTGDVVWELAGAGGIASPAIVDDVIYAASALGIDQRDSGSLYALDLMTGRELWKVETGPIVLSPIVSGGLIHVADHEGNLRAFGVPPE
jgi:outer membrane protein assembly factor BamB